MNITHYAFGKITIDGREYTSDVIVFADRVHSPWWRKEGHKLHLEDLPEVLTEAPAVLVIGTGYFGRMAVPQETLDALHARGIRTRIASTRDAIDEFQRLQREAARVVAALHLTC
ncbi:MAG TPA: MTH938/NDUFAF3 family protein [Methylococcus sp.]|nr:MTH938/NDUFAF3 family protein [Methylococcus sp.]